MKHEQILNNFCRNILGAHRKSSNFAIKGELGVYPLSISIYEKIIKYWFHLIVLKKNGNDLIGSTLVESYNMASVSSRHSWFTSVTYLLRLAGINPGVMNSVEKAEQKRIISTLRNKLKQEYERIFFENIETSGKLSTVYAKVKTTYKIEDYLNKIRYFKYRSAITKMRISSHTLPIETGRWKDIPRAERTCLICDNEEIGSEEHYITPCNNPTLQLLRQQTIEEARKIGSPAIFNLDILKDFSDTNGPLRGKFIYSLLETIKTLETEAALQTCQ